MINFIRTSIKKIQEAKDNNKLVVFVGSGVSKNSDVPSWNDLIKDFIEELDIDKSNFKNSLEDYLRVPQIYYNERGKKEYFDKIYKKFNDIKYKPNIIHKSILELNPEHIITTNFDNLLEKAAIKYGKDYNVIRSNSDLSYNVYKNSIIKMHGDFKYKNIVFKEDDYLSYSDNFRLIENYIKSLFSTHLILFIGYSARDYDFKLIFQWVKNILNDDFQPAYMLEVNEFKKTEFNYYKNKGINKIYYDLIKKEIDKSKKISNSGFIDVENIKGKKLYHFINLLNYNNFKNKNLIENVYNKLSKFDDLNKLIPEDIRNELNNLKINTRLSIESDGYHLIIKKCEISKYKKSKIIYSLKRKNTKKVKFLRKVLKKANIVQLDLYNNKSISLMDNNVFNCPDIKSDFFEFQYNFNLIKLKKLINSSVYTDDDSYKIFEKSYYLYKLKDYIKSYDILKFLSVRFFKSQNYTLYFITKFNMKQLYNLIKFSNQNNQEQRGKIEVILEEINKIDLNEIYSQLSKYDKKSLHFMKEIIDFNFVYKILTEVNKHLKEIKDEKSKIENGDFKFSKDIYEIYHKTKVMWEYINDNYIMIEHFSEIKTFYSSFIEGILTSHSIESNNDSDIFPNNSLNKIKKIDYWILYLAIKNMDNKRLEKLLNKLELSNINVSTRTKKKLVKSFGNLVHYIKNNINNINHITKFTNNSLNYMSNFLILFNKIKFSNKDYDELVEISLDLFNLKLNYNSYKYLFNFLTKTISFNKISKENIRSLLVNIIKSLKIDNKKTNSYYIENIKNANIIEIVTDYIENNDVYINEIISNFYSFIIKVKYNLSNISNNNLVVYFNLLLSLYKFMNKDMKNLVNKLINEFLNYYASMDNNYRDMLSIYFYIFNNINKNEINFYNSLQEKYIILIKNIIKNYKDEDIYPDPVNMAIYDLIYLVLDRKFDISNFKKDIKKLAKNNDFLNYIYTLRNNKNYDYNNFKIEWILYLPEKEVDNLLNDNKTKNILTNKLINEIKQNGYKNKYKKIINKF